MKQSQHTTRSPTARSLVRSLALSLLVVLQKTLLVLLRLLGRRTWPLSLGRRRRRALIHPVEEPLVVARRLRAAAGVRPRRRSAWLTTEALVEILQHGTINQPITIRQGAWAWPMSTRLANQNTQHAPRSGTQNYVVRIQSITIVYMGGMGVANVYKVTKQNTTGWGRGVNECIQSISLLQHILEI